MINFVTVRNVINTNKFDSLTLVENGFILKNRKKGEKKIFFSELDKIYIQKFKIHPVFELLFILFPFILMFIVLQYYPFDLLIIAAMFTVLPVFISVHNCKWYKLIVHLKDGSFFIKKVSLDLKSENISLLNKVNNEYLYYNANALKTA